MVWSRLSKKKKKKQNSEWKEVKKKTILSMLFALLWLPGNISNIFCLNINAVYTADKHPLKAFYLGRSDFKWVFFWLKLTVMRIIIPHLHKHHIREMFTELTFIHFDWFNSLYVYFPCRGIMYPGHAAFPHSSEKQQVGRKRRKGGSQGGSWGPGWRRCVG